MMRAETPRPHPTGSRGSASAPPGARGSRRCWARVGDGAYHRHRRVLLSGGGSTGGFVGQQLNVPVPISGHRPPLRACPAAETLLQGKGQSITGCDARRHLMPHPSIRVVRVGEGWDTKPPKAAQAPCKGHAPRGDTPAPSLVLHGRLKTGVTSRGTTQRRASSPNPSSLLCFFWSWSGTDHPAEPSARARQGHCHHPWARWGFLSLAKPSPRKHLPASSILRSNLRVCRKLSPIRTNLRPVPASLLPQAPAERFRLRAG